MSMEDLIEISDVVSIREAIISGADVNSVDRTGGTALMAAVSDRDQSMVEWLIEHGANVNQQDKFGWTALHCAAQEKHIPIGELLLLNNADINAVDKKNGKTPIGYAFDVTNLSFVKFLLDHGAKTNIPNLYGVTIDEAYGHIIKDL